MAPLSGAAQLGVSNTMKVAEQELGITLGRHLEKPGGIFEQLTSETQSRNSLPSFGGIEGAAHGGRPESSATTTGRRTTGSEHGASALIRRLAWPSATGSSWMLRPWSTNDSIADGEDARAPFSSASAPPMTQDAGPLDRLLAVFAAMPVARAHADGRVAHSCIFHRDRHPSAVVFGNGNYFCSVCQIEALPSCAWITTTEPEGLVAEERVRAAMGVAGSSVPWSDPESTLDALLPVHSWSSHLLRASLRPWAADVVERMGCPPQFLIVAIIVAFGSVVGRRCVIRPRTHDDLTVIGSVLGGDRRDTGRAKEAGSTRRNSSRSTP